MNEDTNEKFDYDEIIAQIEELYYKYSTERRASIQPYRLESIQSAFQEYQYTTDDDIVSESLLEHIGTLPIIATALFPHINDGAVNLGEALIMLAIHDIGELTFGDEITFTKSNNSHQAEQEEALKLLDEIYHEFYLKIENQNGKTAKFAKSVDKITPDFIDYFSPVEPTVKRYKEKMPDLIKDPGDICRLKHDHKHKYMTWSPFLKDLHLRLLQVLEKKLKA